MSRGSDEQTEITDYCTVISISNYFLKNYTDVIELAERIWYFNDIKA